MDKEPVINKQIETKNEWPKSFETERGSVYTYDNEGKTSRLKVITGEQYPTQDITIFVDLNNAEGQQVKIACDRGDKVYVAEKKTDEDIEIIRKLGDIKNKDKLYLIIVKDRTAIFGKKALLTPTIGYQVFDTKYFQEDNGQRKTTSHLGNKVTKINY
ncbi:MAG: hypothetical protein PHX34_03315 [Candidatus Shapirobacteria bacterium]|nr:hypothetical protein [Candidatus Shapirobacteria bacterium]